MLNRLIEMQERKLEKLGADRVQEQVLLEEEKQRMENLRKLKDSMGQTKPESALLLQNRAGIRGQIDNLIGMQEHKVAAANANLTHKSQAVMSQFGKVKAFQTVESKKAAVKAARDKRQEQIQNDDWISQSLRRA